MKKNRVILLFGLIVILSGWWVLQGGGETPPEPGVLDVWATWGIDADQLQKFFDRFGLENGITVRVVTQIRSDVLEAALTGDHPPDLVILSSSALVQSYASQALLEPLDDWAAASEMDLAELYPAALAQCSLPEGETVCLPWGVDIDVLYWNKALFAEAGLDPERAPRTMEELADYAEKLTKRGSGGELLQVGFIPGFPHSQSDLFARMYGASFDESGDRAGIDGSQPVVDVAEWQARFGQMAAHDELADFMASFTPYMKSSHPIYAGSRLSCQQCHRASLVKNNKTPDMGFVTGKVAMMMDGVWHLLQAETSAEKTLPDFGAAPFPPSFSHTEQAGSVIVQGPVLVIPAGAADKAAASKLAAWIVEPANAAEAARDYAMLPPGRAAAGAWTLDPPAYLPMLVDLAAGQNAAPRLSAEAEAEINRQSGGPVDWQD